MSGDQNGKVRLLICDDHRILGDALMTVAGLEPWLAVVAPPARTCFEAVQLCKEHRPDVVLMDVTLEGPQDGIEATRQVKEVSPDSRVIVLTAHDENEYLVRAMEAGASGFMSKGHPIHEVLDAVKAAATGEMVVDPARLAAAIPEVAARRAERRDVDRLVANLTGREIEILKLIADGTSKGDLAVRLHLSPHTVQTHIRNILAKLQVRSKLEAVAIAARAGLLSR